MRLHVVGLPHTRFTDQYSWCAYTTKVARFARMMTEGAGIDVITYGNGPADLPGKYVMVTDIDYDDHFIPEFDASLMMWSDFNNRATARILEHIESDDIVCLIGGLAQAPIAFATSAWPTVEFGVGYEGVFARYRVWESYTWQHYVLGMRQEHGSPDDAVIYNYFDPDAFYLTRYRRGYVAFLGRVCPVKGIDVAVAAAKKAGMPLKIAGHIFEGAEWVRELEGDVEYVGELGERERAEFLAQAWALIAPTRYVEPFGGVHVEAMLSGVPVIVPDYGAFTEFVTPEVGRRCRSLDDYAHGIRHAGDIGDREAIRQYAMDKFSMWHIAEQYADYFERVASR